MTESVSQSPENSSLDIPQEVDSSRIIQQLADELSVKASQVSAAVGLMDEGATVPFIARYRKEVTGGLDDTVLRQLEVRLLYVRELEERRLAILESINSQEKLSAELYTSIMAADTKQRLEDLYAPYKPKRRTRAQIAIEAGLEPLANAILANKNAIPEELAANYLNEEHKITDTKAALDGARDILAERFAEDADLWRKCVNFSPSKVFYTLKWLKAKKRKVTSSVTGTSLVSV
ncbi:RNA-binding transcriptional accessory protein [Oligella ureolytica]